MANQPDRIKSWVLDNPREGIKITADPKIPSAITVIFEKQDHTLGGMLRSQLLQDPAVLFAGYRVPHPLISDIELRLQTDGTITPRVALRNACIQLTNTTRVLQKQFKEQVEQRRMEDAAMAMAAGVGIGGAGVGVGVGAGGYGGVGGVGGGAYGGQGGNQTGAYGEQAAYGGGMDVEQDPYAETF